MCLQRKCQKVKDQKNKNSASTTGYIVVRYGNLDTWINLLIHKDFYQPRYNLGRFYVRRYYPS